MTVDLSKIKVQNQSSFAQTGETLDDTLYFVEANVVVSSSRSGNSWTRTWSDNWCERGGQTANVSAGSTTTVTLNPAFIDANYTIQITGIGSYSGTTSSTPVVTSKSAGSFTIRNGSSFTQAFMWEAKGFIS